MRVVLVTGASEGIGLATALHLAKKGYTVYATCRDLTRATKLQNHEHVHVLSLDVNSSLSVEAAVSRIIGVAGRIDVVVNNAGYGVYGPPETHTIEEMRQIFDTNVFGVWRVKEAVAPFMKPQKSGLFIDLGSTTGVHPSKNLSVYGASKVALDSLAATCAYRHRRDNIRHCVLQPGTTVSSFEARTPYGSREVVDVFYNIEEARQLWGDRMKKGRPAEEVAQLIQEVIETKQPRFWYQTPSTISVETQFRDPTGNSRIPNDVEDPVEDSPWDYREPPSLSDTKVFVTGADSPLGRRIAKELTLARCDIVAGCKDPAQFLSDFGRIWSNLTVVQLDVRSQKSVDHAVSLAGNTRVLIHAEEAQEPSYNLEGLQSVFETNVLGMMRVTQALLPTLRAGRGRIITLLDLAGLCPEASRPFVSASMAARESLMAVECHYQRKWGVPVSMVIHSETPSTKAVAKAALAIMSLPQPLFWYPTSAKVVRKLTGHYVDLWGQPRVPADAAPIRAKL